MRHLKETKEGFMLVNCKTTSCSVHLEISSYSRVRAIEKVKIFTFTPCGIVVSFQTKLT
jgi:hypothetical protein